MIGQAKKSYQHNPLLSTNEKILLNELLAELEEYRKNPLTQIPPCMKYVRENNIQMQLEHVTGECYEVGDAMTLDDIALEWFDVLQGAVTGMAILAIKYGVDLDKLIKRGIAKNTDREGGSYYV